MGMSVMGQVPNIIAGKTPTYPGGKPLPVAKPAPIKAAAPIAKPAPKAKPAPAPRAPVAKTPTPPAPKQVPTPPPLPYGGPITMPGGPFVPRPDLGPGVGFGPGLPTPDLGMPTFGMGGGKSAPGGPQIGLPGGPQFNPGPGESSPLPPNMYNQQPLTTWQQLGYNSLEEAKAAMDPNMGNAQIGFGMPPPDFANALGTASPALNTIGRF